MMTREEQFLQMVQVGVIVHEARKPPRSPSELPRDVSDITGDYSLDAVIIMSLAQQVVLTGRLPSSPSPFTLTREYLSFMLERRRIGSAPSRAEKPAWLDGIGWMANNLVDEEERNTAIGFLTEASSQRS
jgi:hypothetical protein